MLLLRSQLALLVLTCIGLSLGLPAGVARPQAQSTRSTHHRILSQRTSRAVQTSRVRGNPDIPRILAAISARNIEATIRKLVSFRHTQHTL